MGENDKRSTTVSIPAPLFKKTEETGFTLVARYPAFLLR